MIVIPVKRVSRRCPGKNMADIHGKPMVARVLGEALQSYGGDVWVLTDDPDVRDCSLGVSARVRAQELPECLVADGMHVPDVMQWWHDEKQASSYQVIQVTTPLATAEDYWRAQRLSNDTGCNVATVSEDREAKTWRRNGACYVWVTRWPRFAEWMTGPVAMYAMPPGRSIDVNTPEDLERVRAMWNR